MKVNNSTSPTQAVRTVIIDVVIDYAPPTVKYPLKYGILEGMVIELRGLATNIKNIK
jgi:hypothetical protein